jgi:hypothetical protein
VSINVKWLAKTTSHHQSHGFSIGVEKKLFRTLSNAHMNCIASTTIISFNIFWDLILVQHQYNNCTITPHMRVDPSMWDLPSCEGLLYSCCIGVVNLTFSIFFYGGLIVAQHLHNMGTTPPHMRVGPTH